MEIKKLVITAMLMSFGAAPALNAVADADIADADKDRPSNGSAFHFLGKNVHPYFGNIHTEKFLIADDKRIDDGSKLGAINKNQLALAIGGAFLFAVPTAVLGAKALKNLEDKILKRIKKAKHKETDAIYKDIITKAFYALIGLSGSLFINKMIIGQQQSKKA